ncbi:vomeronasal type-1 receptor 4-like [Phodopus roborovskii]|uniref:vomeronasal type-1 receptor 4-like n=1 Tax=Phodopus roborovskii TaxID=109678 RepID=UPI0021E44DF2|nr:vomeronasal type-1 receptor 4-like [Phodopus roborovskii]
MDIWILAIRIILLLQTTIGILGNFSLMFYYLVLCSRECILKPTDLILMNLMATNALIILSAGVPQTMAAFGWKEILNGLGCRLLLYIQGFGRSVSIGITCLLSIFQAMTISNKISSCKEQKVKSTKYIVCSISLLCVFYMLINSIFFLYTFFKRKSKNVTTKRDFGYCSIVGSDEVTDALYTVLVVCPEVFFSFLMAWSSGSTIVILYRHKQRVQHIHSIHGPSRTSPETRATQNILVLLSAFLAFYTVSSILRGCISFLHNHNWWLVNINSLTSLCFPSFGPFVLINNYSIMSTITLIWIRSKNKFMLFSVHR